MIFAFGVSNFSPPGRGTEEEMGVSKQHMDSVRARNWRIQFLNLNIDICFLQLRGKVQQIDGSFNLPCKKTSKKSDRFYFCITTLWQAIEKKILIAKVRILHCFCLVVLWCFLRRGMYYRIKNTYFYQGLQLSSTNRVTNGNSFGLHIWTLFITFILKLWLYLYILKIWNMLTRVGS